LARLNRVDGASLTVAGRRGRSRPFRREGVAVGGGKLRPRGPSRCSPAAWRPKRAPPCRRVW